MDYEIALEATGNITEDVTGDKLIDDSLNVRTDSIYLNTPSDATQRIIKKELEPVDWKIVL